MTHSETEPNVYFLRYEIRTKMLAANTQVFQEDRVRAMK